MKILIAEDELVSNKLLGKVLDKMGFEFISAEDGLKAWELFQENEISMVITDWMMPNMDGVALTKKIRESTKDRYVYIILLTAKDEKQDLIEAFGTGVDDYISKPFDFSELQGRIKTGERILKLQEDHRSLERILVESRNKLKSVFDSLDEEIISIDRDLNIVSINYSFLKSTGAEFGDVVGKSFISFVDENKDTEERSSLKSKVTGAFESGTPQFFLQISERKPGEEVYKEIKVLPIKSETDEIIQAVIVLRDVTEERRQSEEIKILNKKLRKAFGQIKTKNEKLEKTLEELKGTQAQILQSEKMSSIGQLAAGVAHEINNPTGFVSSNLKTLSDYYEDIEELIKKYRSLVKDLSKNSQENQSPDIVKHLEQIASLEEEKDVDFVLEDIVDLIGDCKEGTDRIKKIVIDLKDFAHPGEDKLQTADINQGLETTLNVVWNEIKYKATVNKDLADLPLVKCYPQQLNQVFMNLLVNAAHAIEEQGEINIATRVKNSSVEIEISDTGAGIPEENLTNIFDPFFTTKEVGKGTGLGLNVAYNIVNKHKGSINVDSKIGEGTTFLITVPIDEDS